MYLPRQFWVLSFLLLFLSQKLETCNFVLNQYKAEDKDVSKQDGRTPCWIRKPVALYLKN